MQGLPQAEVELPLIAGRSWSRTFSQRETDQITLKTLEGYTVGYASFKARASDEEALIVFDVAIDHDEDSATFNKATATATREASAGVTRETLGVFDCVLVHENGVSTLEICPPVAMRVTLAPTDIPEGP